MKFSGKISLVIMLNVTKKTVSLPSFPTLPFSLFTLYLENTFFGKTTGKGGGVVKCQIDHSLAYFSAINIITSPTVNRYSPPT